MLIGISLKLLQLPQVSPFSEMDMDSGVCASHTAVCLDLWKGPTGLIVRSMAEKRVRFRIKYMKQHVVREQNVQLNELEACLFRLGDGRINLRFIPHTMQNSTHTVLSWNPKIYMQP